MTISSHSSTENQLPYQRSVNSLCFIVMAVYYISVLYFITMTAEKSHNNLKMLATPLQQSLVEEQDGPRLQSLKLLLKEVESVGPLTGNGYFDISRGTLTSIVSISLTYFIILLQFRTG